MKKINILLCVGIAAIFTFTSCKKSSSTPAAPSSNAPTINTPSNADGAMAAVQVITSQTVAGYTVPINIGTAVAWFGSASNYADAGNVSCANNPLTKSNNAYVFQPTATSPEGISFNNSVAWAVTGNGSVTGFTYTDYSSFPSIEDITASGSISASGAFTLSATTSVYGDSVIFVVVGSQKHLSYTAGPNTSSHTFSAAEMATVGASANSTGLLQIAPYRVNHQSINGKSYYFIKESCVSKFVTIN